MDSICPTICVGSIGDVGSCVFNCAIKSCKNKSPELLASASVDLLLLVEPLCEVWSARGNAARGLIVIFCLLKLHYLRLVATKHECPICLENLALPRPQEESCRCSSLDQHDFAAGASPAVDAHPAQSPTTKPDSVPESQC